MNELKERLDKLERLLITLGKKALTFEEGVIYTGLKKSYLYKLTSTNRIPHYKPRAKMVYFDREELDAWLLQNPIKTKAEIEAEADTYIALNKKR